MIRNALISLLFLSCIARGDSLFNERRAKPDDCYTQGLSFYSGKLYESCGHYGESRIRVWQLPSWRLTLEHALPRDWFAEGNSVFDNKLYQLSWKKGELRIYQLPEVREIRRLRYRGEGWGLTNDGQWLIRSDGSDTLYYHDPLDFHIVKRVSVTLNGQPLAQLNELEWTNHGIYANVWQSQVIVRINNETGTVDKIIRLEDLQPAADDFPRADVLNGIVSQGEQLLVTGKYWPYWYWLDKPK